jgi:hypothetical protein
MSRSVLLILLLCAASSLLCADPLPFRAAIDVQEVVATNTAWQLFGRVYDTSVAGFTGLDLASNDLFACETPLQDVDLYRVTSIETQNVEWARFTVEYLGTGATPRVGAPVAGQGYLCRAFGTNGVALPQYYGPGGVSPFLKDAIASDAIRRLAERPSATSTSSPSGPESDPVYSTGGVSRAGLRVQEGTSTVWSAASETITIGPGSSVTNVLASTNSIGALQLVGNTLIYGTNTFYTLCLVNRYTVQPVTNATLTTILFTNVVQDIESGFDTSTGTYSVKTPGAYIIYSNARFANATAGKNNIQLLFIDGVEVDRRFHYPQSNGDVDSLSTCGFQYCTNGTLIRVSMYQDTGSTLNIYGATYGGNCFLRIMRVGP